MLSSTKNVMNITEVNLNCSLLFWGHSDSGLHCVSVILNLQFPPLISAGDPHQVF